jgi:hypothetical protein
MANYMVAGLGVCLLALTALEIVPMRLLAEAISDDGQLSDLYAHQFVASQTTIGFCLIGAALLFGWLPAGRLVSYCCGIPFWMVATGCGFVAMAGGWYVQEFIFDGIPHVTDAISHLFQSKIFSLGRMYAPAPDCPDIFYQFHILMTHSGKWFTKYTPGTAILLAGAEAIGMQRWILPVCGGLITVMLGWLIQKFDRPDIARGVMFLFALSPLALLLSGSFMSHVPALFYALAGFTCYVYGRESKSRIRIPLWFIACGFLLGHSALTRPHEFLMIGLVAFLYFLTLPGREWMLLFRRLPWIIAGLAPVLAMWAIWNHTIYGNPLAIGYGFTSGDVMHQPFQGSFGLSSSFTLFDAVKVLIWNLDRVNHSFFGWPTSLLFVPLAFLRRGNRLVLISSLAILIFVGTYFLYDYRAEFESRYYYIALPFFAYLTAKGIANAGSLHRSPAVNMFVNQTVMLTCLAFYAYAVTHYWPSYLIPKYRAHYEDASRLINRTVMAQVKTPALCLIDGSNNNPFIYSSGFLFNDPELKGHVIFGRYIESELPCVFNAFSDRHIYVYRGSADGQGAVIRIRSAVSGGTAGEHEILSTDWHFQNPAFQSSQPAK